LTIIGSTLSDNSTPGSGGGIYNINTLTVTNSTLSGNSASSSGGGINNGLGTVLLNPFFAISPSGVLVNSIVANSPSGGDLVTQSGSFYFNGHLVTPIGYFSGNNDLIGDGSLLSSFTNSISGNPLLAPLGNYGGPTQTLALLPGSPAINAGAPVSGLTADQRGKSYVGAPDIGAFESQGFTITATSGSGQNAARGATFANPLVATVTANDPLEPAAGGVVRFAAPSSGATAALSGGSATITAGGTASVTATADHNIGSYSVTASAHGVTGAASFNLTNGIGVVIDKLTITGLTVGNKVYDGTTAATITSFGTLVGVLPGDIVTLNTSGASARFSQASVGNGLAVTISGLTLTGPYEADYTLTLPTVTANITPAPLTVTVDNQSRLFGTPNPALTGTPSGVVGGDNITASYATTADASSPPGTYAITATLNDPLNRLRNYTVTNTPGTLTVISPAPVVVGGFGVVQVTDPATGQVSTFAPFAGYLGEVRVAVGDVTGDGVADIVVGSGPGADPHVKVFDGATGLEVRSFDAFDPAFAGGVTVAVGDVTGDGVGDIIVGAGRGSSNVKVFDGASGAVVRSFMAFPGFTGGVSVAAGDLDGDQVADIIVGAGPGADPHVVGFSGRTGAILLSFDAFAPAFTGGVWVAAGDLNGAGTAEVVVGEGAGADALVRVFNSAGATLAGLQAFDPGFQGSVRVGVADVNGDSLPDVLLGAGPGAGPHVEALAWPSLALLESRMAFDPSVSSGVYVA
jgi:hypothetical protein